MNYIFELIEYFPQHLERVDYNDLTTEQKEIVDAICAFADEQVEG